MEWQRKGATLSDKTARQELGLAELEERRAKLSSDLGE